MCELGPAFATSPTAKTPGGDVRICPSTAMGIAAAGLMIVLFHEEHAYVFEGIGSPTLCFAIVATVFSIFATPESLSSHLGGVAGGSLAMLALPMRGMMTPAPVRAIAVVLLIGGAAAFCLYAFA